MSELGDHVTETAKRFTEALGAEKAADLTDSLRQLGEELAEQVREHPVQAISSALALGYVAVRLAQAPGSMVPRIIGKGIGSVVAARFLDRLTQKTPHPGNSGLRH